MRVIARESKVSRWRDDNEESCAWEGKKEKANQRREMDVFKYLRTYCPLHDVSDKNLRGVFL